jgi:hypothetical protein
MKLKVIQSLIYGGIVYNSGEVVDILESDIIERVKTLELVESEEVEETTEENTEVEETTEENTEVEEANKNSKKSKRA